MKIYPQWVHHTSLHPTAGRPQRGPVGEGWGMGWRARGESRVGVLHIGYAISIRIKIYVQVCMYTGSMRIYIYGRVLQGASRLSSKHRKVCMQYRMYVRSTVCVHTATQLACIYSPYIYIYIYTFTLYKFSKYL